MKIISLIAACLTICMFSVAAAAQRPEVTISLNEAFFDSLLDAVFQHASPIEFSIASGNVHRRDTETRREETGIATSSDSAFNRSKSINYRPVSLASPHPGGNDMICKETIQLLRETNGVRTAVRFREGKILAPIAFSGNYNPPLIGCVPFAGYAETTIDLEFDQQGQRLVARARVYNVSLNGTGGVGGSLIAKMVQNSIDKKVNPIEILRMEKLAFALPVQNTGGLRMKATGVRHDLENNQLRIHIAYEFTK
jgi:hypothetical protein